VGAVRYSEEMRHAPLILASVSGAGIVAALIVFEIWGQVQYARSWDALLWVGLGADVVGALSGCVAVGLLLASWISQRSQVTRGSLSHS
jgi:hypothetical protein